jgi:hypothetical protein
LDRASGDARSRLKEIVDDLERADAERIHDAKQRARWLKTTDACEGLTLTCAPRLRDEGTVIESQLAAATGLEVAWSVKDVVSEKGESVRVERCAVCSPRLVLAVTKEPVRVRLSGVRRWYSEYEVVFENPKNGDSKRVGDFTLDVEWPLVVITSKRPVAWDILPRTASQFSYDLKRPADDTGGERGRFGGRTIFRGAQRAPAGWCSCLKGPTPWKEIEVPTVRRHTIEGSRADQFTVDQIARLRFTFRKPVEEPFALDGDLLKP